VAVEEEEKYDVVRGPIHTPNHRGARPHPCQRLHGQLYQLLAPRRSLYRLDRYEDCRPGNPRYGRYSRQRVPVEVGQQTVWAWIYWFRGPRSR